jgi:hypothetical protein
VYPSPALSRERAGVRVPEHLVLRRSRTVLGSSFGPLASILSPRTCGERRATAVCLIARIVMEKIDTLVRGNDGPTQEDITIICEPP